MDTETLKSLINKFSIYQYVTAFLIILILTDIFFYGSGTKSLIYVLIAALTAIIFDSVLSYFRYKTFEFHKCSLISGLFIGGILSQDLPLYIYAAAGAIAILSKHIIRFQGKHIFNPANFGILIVTLIFPIASDVWWIANPLVLVVLFGLFILWRLRRFDLGLSFLISYFVINSIYEFIRGATIDVVLSSLLGGTIFFFAMFMLIEPRTHPRKYRIAYGIIVAVILVILQNLVAYGITLSLAIGNIVVLILDRINFAKKEIPVEAKETITDAVKKNEY